MEVTTGGSPEAALAETLAPPSIRYEACGHSIALVAQLNNLRANKDLFDVTLRVDGSQFQAHKVVLCASSPYFRAMFTSAYIESAQDTVVLHDITAEALQQVIDFFYTSKLTISTGNVQELLSAACMLQVTALKEACCEFLRRHIGVSNCLGVCAFADTHSCLQLRALSDDYARRHFARVVHSEEFLQLHPDQLVDLIGGDVLSVESEEQVFDAVMDWVKYDVANREKCVADILAHVRLPLLKPSFLLNISTHEVAKRSQKVLLLVMDAIGYHLLPERKNSLPPHWLRPRVSNGKIEVMLAMGGMGRREPTNSVEQYSANMTQWKAVNPMVTNRWGAGAVILDNSIYVVGGSNISRLNTVDRYDLKEEKWCTDVAEMASARNGVGVVALGGFLYAIGGFDGVAPLKTVEQYSPQSNRWTPVPDMSSSRFGLGACTCNGLIYAIGGSDGSNLNTAEVFDPNKRTWSPIAPMHMSRKFPGAVTLGGFIYVIGGSDASSRHNSVERYMPSLNQWTTVTPLLVARSAMGTVVLDGYIYVAGGHDGNNSISSVERYDPLLNTWSQAPPSMSTAREGVCLVGMEQQVPKVTTPLPKTDSPLEQS